MTIVEMIEHKRYNRQENRYQRESQWDLDDSLEQF